MKSEDVKKFGDKATGVIFEAIFHFSIFTEFEAIWKPNFGFIQIIGFHIYQYFIDLKLKTEPKTFKQDSTDCYFEVVYSFW